MTSAMPSLSIASRTSGKCRRVPELSENSLSVGTGATVIDSIRLSGGEEGV